MEATFVITPNVINTINSLPLEERVAMVSALAGELILGATRAEGELTPMQEVMYSMIRGYVRRDTARFLEGHAAADIA